MKKLPKEVYVTREDADGEEYLLTHEKLDKTVTTSSIGEAVKVGVYKLVEILEVRAVVEMDVIKHAKKGK